MELPHDPVRLRLVKACALLLMGSAAWRVAPGVASHGLGHTLLLMDANEPFMIRAGLSRLEWLLALEGVHAAAIDRGVVTKLLDLLRRPDLDQGAGEVGGGGSLWAGDAQGGGCTGPAPHTGRTRRGSTLVCLPPLHPSPLGPTLQAWQTRQ